MTKPLLVVIGIFWAMGVAYGMYSNTKAKGLASDLDSVRLDLVNMTASRDTSEFLVRQEGDSLVAVARRTAFQDATIVLRAAFKDSVEQLVTAVARFQLQADSLRRTVEGSVAEVDSVGVIVARGRLDAIDSLGVEVHAVVTIPPSQPSVWDIRVRRQAINLELALTCRDDLAFAQLAGPSFATLQLDSVVQTPDICITPTRLPSWQPFAIRLPSLPVAIGLTVLGMFVEDRLHLFGGN